MYVYAGNMSTDCDKIIHCIILNVFLTFSLKSVRDSFFPLKYVQICQPDGLGVLTVFNFFPAGWFALSDPGVAMTSLLWWVRLYLLHPILYEQLYGKFLWTVPLTASVATLQAATEECSSSVGWRCYCGWKCHSWWCHDSSQNRVTNGQFQMSVTFLAYL